MTIKAIACIAIYGLTCWALPYPMSVNRNMDYLWVVFISHLVCVPMGTVAVWGVSKVADLLSCTGKGE